MVDLKCNYEQTLLHSKLEIQEETLRTLNHEIHDNIGQVLSLAKLQLNTLPISTDEGTAEVINLTKDLVGKAITDLRNLSKGLHPDRVDELGLEENIRYELEILEKTRMYKTRLVIMGSPYKIAVQVQTILFRMVQEGISNIIKHAAADLIEVIVDYSPDCFILLVRDNGVGLPQEAAEPATVGIGLQNIRNRSEVIGAVFNLEQTPGGGTTVKISIPIAA